MVTNKVIIINLIWECYLTVMLIIFLYKRLCFKSMLKISILCTDSHKSYIKFATDFNLDHKRIKAGKHKEGIYHIQHVNSLHSNLKKWMGRFNGIASKYISNYMQWFK